MNRTPSSAALRVPALVMARWTLAFVVVAEALLLLVEPTTAVGVLPWKVHVSVVGAAAILGLGMSRLWWGLRSHRPATPAT